MPTGAAPPAPLTPWPLTADTVVRGVTASDAEKPVTVDGFRCTPSVVSTGPDVVKWSCNFKGADTDTDVTLRFEATYKG